MGLIDTYKNEWNWNLKVNKYQSKVIFNGLNPSNTFLNSLSFKKARQSFYCGICQKTKPKNTRYIGDQYQKVCFNCASEWIKNSIKVLEEMKTLLKKDSEDLIKNKDKWKREMMLGGLS